MFYHISAIIMSTSLKICIIGDFCVGKTSLIRRFVDKQFSDEYLSTVGMKMSRKSILLPEKNSVNAEEIQLLIWDIEGSNKFKAIAPTYFQGAKGAVIVGDVTRSETLNHLSEHIQSFLAVNPKSSVIVALNKSDLIDAEYLDNLRQLYLFTNNASVLNTYFTSAKSGNNVNEIFQILTSSII